MRFIILFGLIIIIIWSVKFVLKKAFNIPRVIRKAFFYNHINKKHRNIDWGVRITALLLYVLLMYQLFYYDFSINLFLLLMTLLFTSENFVRGFFEWKFSTNPKESILTIAEAITLIIIILIIIKFNILQFLF